MITIEPGKIPTRDLHQYLLGSVSPRPIAFVSTIDKDGNPNLAPYSFFNCFSSNPPILVFSSNRRVVNNTTKDTLANVMATKEAVVNVVNHDIVRQMSVTAIEFDANESEFEKAGLTPIPSEEVKPFRVKESPVHMECKVQEIITLGEHGGAGHLIICKVVKMHIDENVVDENNRIDPHKIDLMGRMGRAYYVRASGEAVSTIIQPVTQRSIGYDNLPKSIQESNILTGNNIGQLAGLHEKPNEADILALKDDDNIKALLTLANPIESLHHYAKEILEDDSERALAARVAWLGEFL